MKRHIKLIKTFFEAIKKRSKKKFYSEKLRKFKGYARKTLGVETRAVLIEISMLC